ncbi:MAG: hypothetical protein IPJ21_18445 [Sterolibacteriaceae bacterium]|nr:hypothetical protein [Sterolibacteriaceae bacterium]MBK9085721.1 hypothetical protein [Sterolibacteriaceae bacterium]
MREIVSIALQRVQAGRPTKSILMVGLRGVGTTVLLDRLRDDADSDNGGGAVFHAVFHIGSRA